MKYVVLSITLCLLLSLPTYAALTAGNHGSAGSTNGQGGTVSLSLSTTGAKLLVMAITGVDPCKYVPSDTIGNTWWRQLGTLHNANTVNTWLYVSYGDQLLTGSDTFTLIETTQTANCLGFPSMAVMAFNSSAPAFGNPLTGFQSFTNTTGTTTIQAGANAGGSLVISVLGGSATSQSIDSSFTLAENFATTANAQSTGLAYRLNAPATNPTWTFGPSGIGVAMNASLAEDFGHTTYTAASCNEPDVEAGLTNLVAGDTLNIPSGTCTWSTQAQMNGTAYWFAPPNVTIQGATVCTGSGNPAINNLACTDNTIIIDAINRAVGPGDVPMLYMLTATTGTFRLTGLTFEYSGTTTSAKGSVNVDFQNSNPTPSARIDHIHFNYSSSTPGNAVTIGTHDTQNGGLADHILMDCPNSCGLHNQGDDGSTHGNGNWAGNTPRGTAQAFYIEDSTTHDGTFSDCYVGGEVVVRFSTWDGGSILTHPTRTNLEQRGCRYYEAYQNFINGWNITGGYFCATQVDAGTSMIWGNNAGTLSTKPDAQFFSNFLCLYSQRRAPYDVHYDGYAGTPTDWGWCGNSIASGYPTRNGPSTTTGSNWDQGTYLGTSLATGYRCLDQPGTGKGDLLSGTFPNVINNTTSGIAWPHQALEPIYEWNDSWQTNPASNGNFVTNYSYDVLINNTDFYTCFNAPQDGTQHTAICTGLGPSSNQTTGVATGTLGQRPNSASGGACTQGVGYWATDQGSWNHATSGYTGQGQLYVCGASNTWTSYYTPYTYPHPLQAASGPTTTFTYYQPINFTSSTAQIPATQTNFPYVVRNVVIAHPSHVTNSSGYDIRPYADNTCSTTPLKYQLLSYTNGTGEILMWVQGTISAGGQAYLCYGNASLTTDGSDTSTAGVFSNYKYRLHGGNGTTLDLTDASGNGNTATNTAVTAAGVIAINGSMAFNGSTSKLAFTGISLTAPYSIREWVNFAGPGGGANDGFQGMALDSAAHGLVLYNDTGSTWVQNFLTTGGASALSHTNIPSNQAHFLEMTWDGTTANFYLDGVLDNGTVTGTPTLSPLVVVNVGNDAGSEAYNGLLEEMGMSGVVNSANWVTSEYYDEKPTSNTFLSLGPEASLAPPTLPATRLRTRKGN